MADINPPVLKKWKIIPRCSIADLEKMVSVNIFRTDVAPEPPSELGALILTTDDVVYRVGSAHPLFGETGGHTLKVEELSGLDVKKLEVGNSHCVALTKDQNLVLWEGHALKKIPDSAFVFYELFADETPCLKCTGNYNYAFTASYSMFELAGLKFNYACHECKCFSPTYGVGDSTGSKQVVKLVKFKEAAIRCTICSRMCNPYKIGDHEVNYCVSCNKLPLNAEYYDDANSELSLNVNLLCLGESITVVDVASGLEFFVALTNKNYLILWGTIEESKYQGTIYNPDNVIVKAFSCGGYHVAVVSVKGDLYTCGRGDRGQLGYEWAPEMSHETLRKVDLGGKVVKVCCGFSSTVCLMDDGSLRCFGSHMKMLSPGVLALNQTYDEYIAKPARIMQNFGFIDVINSPLTNIYVAKTEALMFAWGRPLDESRQPALVLGGGDLMVALADLPAVITIKTRTILDDLLKTVINSLRVLVDLMR